MSVFLTLEDCPAESRKTAQTTPEMPSLTSHANAATTTESPLSHLWRGICNFFAGIFQSRERSWKEIAKGQEREIVSLKARLAEKTESERGRNAWMEAQIQQGARCFGDTLASYASGVHALRMGEIRGLFALFQRHEELVVRHQRQTQAHQELASDYVRVREDNGFLMRQNEELSRRNIELENGMSRERRKNAMYERAWYGSGGGAQESTHFWAVDV